MHSRSERPHTVYVLLKLLYNSPPCSFLKEFSDLKRKIETQPNEAIETSLCLLIRAVTSNVSVLRERCHEQFLQEMFSIQLWNVPKVSGSDRFC